MPALEYIVAMRSGDRAAAWRIGWWESAARWTAAACCDQTKRCECAGEDIYARICRRHYKYNSILPPATAVDMSCALMSLGIWHGRLDAACGLWPIESRRAILNSAHARAPLRVPSWRLA